MFFLSSNSHLLQQVGLWIFGGKLNIDAVTAAILGLSVLLITGVVTWKECLSEAVAWDTLTWFAALIAMAGYLNKYGLISWFSQTVVKVSSSIPLSCDVYLHASAVALCYLLNSAILKIPADHPTSLINMLTVAVPKRFPHGAIIFFI